MYKYDQNHDVCGLEQDHGDWISSWDVIIVL